MTLTIVSHQDRNRRLVEEIIGYSPEQPFPQAGVAIPAHDDEVSLSPYRFRDQLGSNTLVSTFRVVQDCADPMVLEVIDRLGAEHSLVLRGAFVGDHDDGYRLRLVRERHPLSEGTTGHWAGQRQRIEE
jgi:hypothetical protein